MSSLARSRLCGRGDGTQTAAHTQHKPSVESPGSLQHRRRMREQHPWIEGHVILMFESLSTALFAEKSDNILKY